MPSKAHQTSQGTRGVDVPPGDYAVGSQQSRAAASALLVRRFAGRIRRTIIADLEADCTEPSIGKWREGADGSLGRVCALPKGMTMQERSGSFPNWDGNPRLRQRPCRTGSGFLQ